MATKAVELLRAATERERGRGFLLIVESGRIDHAHHAGNAWRAIVETEELDRALGAVVEAVDLADTLVVATADHSHVFSVGGYPLRPPADLPYTPRSEPAEWANAPSNGVFGVVYELASNGFVRLAEDEQGVPYTPLAYGNGPGWRLGIVRRDPRIDGTPGFGGAFAVGPNHPAYLQEATVPLGAETHGAEDVGVWAVGRGSSAVRGTLRHADLFDLVRRALRLPEPDRSR